MIRVLFSIGAAAAFTLFPVILTAGQGVSCASLIVIDGDTIKCDGQNMRLLGSGVPFKSGVDAPEMGSRAKCAYERDLALKAKARLKELLFAGTSSFASTKRWTEASHCSLTRKRTGEPSMISSV